MNYHEKLEEYINNTKYNKKNLIKLEDEKLENIIKLTNRTHKDSIQFSVVDNSTNCKHISNHSKTILIGNTHNNYNQNDLGENESYKNSANNKTSVFNANTSFISHHNYTTIDARKPTNFTESIAYNTRNYSTIVKDCLNFDDVSNISKYDISKFLPKKEDQKLLNKDEKDKIVNYNNILIVKPNLNANAKIQENLCDLNTKPNNKSKEKLGTKNKKKSNSKIQKNLQINSLRSLNEFRSDCEEENKIRNKNKAKKSIDSFRSKEDSGKEEGEEEGEINITNKKNKKRIFDNSSSFSEERLKIEDLNLKKKGKKPNTNTNKKKQSKKADTIKHETLDDSFEVPKGFFKVYALDKQARKKIKIKKSKSKINNKNDFDDYLTDGTSSDSLSAETNSQSSGVSYSDVKDYNANLAWHKLDFEIEFGIDTSRIKEKFLNFEI